MKKIYTTPRMEVTKMQQLEIICGSDVKVVEGDLGYTGSGTGGGRAPMMPDFDEFEDQFDFTDIKLW